MATIWKSMVAGAVAGAAAVAVMNTYQAAVNAASKGICGKPALNLDDAATRDVAQSLGVPFAVVQYGAGISLGALYGLLAESFPAVTAGDGTAFGAVAWLAGDEVAAPLLGLAQGCEYQRVAGHANALAGHVVFGAVTHYIRKALVSRAAFSEITKPTERTARFGTLQGIVQMTAERFRDATRPMTDEEADMFLEGRH